MRLPKIILMLTVTSFLLTGCTSVGKNVAQNTPSVNTQSEEKVDYQTSFEIYTDGLKRNFTNPKYHNQSPDVFITVENPSIVHVKKANITWSDFFNTLPMKLTKECLITGDGETFCNGQDGTLRFYLNDVEDKDLLEREIKDGDRALIKFTS